MCKVGASRAGKTRECIERWCSRHDKLKTVCKGFCSSQLHAGLRCAVGYKSIVCSAADVACCAADVTPAEIFKRAPEVMFRALVMHNSVIRTAKYANCGFVLEQEGDSFTLAFYNAFDAVAFCLQVGLKTS
jgi:hypothetical protein